MLRQERKNKSNAVQHPTFHGTPRTTHKSFDTSLPEVDLVVIGSVAVDPKTGARIGKGEGFAEIEYGVMRMMGVVRRPFRSILGVLLVFSFFFLRLRRNAVRVP